MATIHICDRCGVEPPSAWYGIELFELNEDGRYRLKRKTLDLCPECYALLTSDFDAIKRNTPRIDVKVVQ